MQTKSMGLPCGESDRLPRSKNRDEIAVDHFKDLNMAVKLGLGGPGFAIFSKACWALYCMSMMEDFNRTRWVGIEHRTTGSLPTVRLVSRVTFELSGKLKLAKAVNIRLFD